MNKLDQLILEVCIMIQTLLIWGGIIYLAIMVPFAIYTTILSKFQ